METGKETEVKVRIPPEHLQEIREKLDKLGFQLTVPRTREDNLLFDDSAGRLKASGCALRLRKYGEKPLLTFKGPRIDDTHLKIREEIETPVGDFQAMKKLLEALGLNVCFEYGKYREKFLLRLDETNVEVCVDETPVGCFVEIEGTRGSIERIAGWMGWSVTQFIKQSYVELYQQESCVNLSNHG